ncbi:metal-dependent transcriptional regulator [Methanomassiliicoccaceae archaeon COG_1]|nr:metal-dependent transcriptional regulator [Methanomassiliicoccaceae archaeon COG_1]
MTTGNREDYLIAILRLTEGGGVAKTTELAQFMGVSPASVSEMLKILAKDGLVEYAKYRGVKLTGAGLTEARLTRKRHHVVERFFTDVLEMDHQEAHEEASRIEHSISDESAVKMCNMLGNPPDCDCQVCVDPCKAVSGTGVAITMLLSDMNEGDAGRISHLKNDDGAVLKKLLSMGFVPGKSISLDAKAANGETTTVVTLGNSSVVIDPMLASSVYVDLGSA